MIVIDGSTGEGGGQMLRTSLGLSMVTGEAFTLERVRGNRSKPGLMRQHLTCVRAAAEICGARVEGDRLRSSEVVFEPGEVRQGDWRFEVGTAGSTALVLQCVLPALFGSASTVEVTGGTFNPMAPTTPFLERAFAPALAAFGPTLTIEQRAAGFYPAGGGELVGRLSAASLVPARFVERGALRSLRIWAAVANLPEHIARREVELMREKLGLEYSDTEVVVYDGPGPGNAAWAVAEYDGVTEVVSGIGEKGKQAERVAEEIVTELEAYMASDAVIGEHLADQLLIPMALAGGGEMLCTEPSQHTKTQAEIIEKFIEVEFSFDEVSPNCWRVVCEA